MKRKIQDTKHKGLRVRYRYKLGKHRHEIYFSLGENITVFRRCADACVAYINHGTPVAQQIHDRIKLLPKIHFDKLIE